MVKKFSRTRILIMACVLLLVQCFVFTSIGLVKAAESDYNGQIIDQSTTGDTSPGDSFNAWMKVKNTGKYAKFKGVLELRDYDDVFYKADDDIEIINSGTYHTFNLAVLIPSNAETGKYWDARLKLYVDVGYWKEVDSFGWISFKITALEEPEIQRNSPDEQVVRVPSGSEVSFSVKVYNADSVKWFIDNIYKKTTYDVEDHITGYKYTFTNDCTVTARAYKNDVSTDPINWNVEISNPSQSSPYVDGYSPSDTSLDLSPGDSTDFKVQVQDPDGDLDKVVWSVDGSTEKTDSSISGSLGESIFHYEAQEGDKEVKAIVYDLQDNSEFINWNLNLDVNSCPSLSNGKVEPLEGGISTNFAFTVTYKDSDSDEPVDSYVRIVGFQGSSKVYDETMKMSKVSGSASTGAVYSYSTKLSEGSYSYYFYFNDGECNVYLPSGGYPGFDGPSVGDVSIDATISDFDVEDGVKYPGDKVSASAIITNSGKAHTFHIEYSIRDSEGAYHTVYEEDKQLGDGENLNLDDELIWVVSSDVSHGDCSGRLIISEPSNPSAYYDKKWDYGLTIEYSKLEVEVRDRNSNLVYGAYVRLYGESGLISEKSTDLNGIASWDSIEAGEYKLKVYKDGFFWGSKQFKISGEGSQIEFKRNSPFIQDASCSFTDSEIIIKVSVNNPSGVQHDLKISSILDDDKTKPWDYIKDIEDIIEGESKQFTITIPKDQANEFLITQLFVREDDYELCDSYGLKETGAEKIKEIKFTVVPSKVEPGNKIRVEGVVIGEENQLLPYRKIIVDKPDSLELVHNPNYVTTDSDGRFVFDAWVSETQEKGVYFIVFCNENENNPIRRHILLNVGIEPFEILKELKIRNDISDPITAKVTLEKESGQETIEIPVNPGETRSIAKVTGTHKDYIHPNYGLEGGIGIVEAGTDTSGVFSVTVGEGARIKGYIGGDGEAGVGGGVGGTIPGVNIEASGFICIGTDEFKLEGEWGYGPSRSSIDVVIVSKYGHIKGQVKDQSGQPVSGATVLALYGNSVVKEAKTDSEGLYDLKLPPWHYNVKVLKKGYETGIAEKDLEAQQTLNIDFTLAEGANYGTVLSGKVILYEDPISYCDVGIYDSSGNLITSTSTSSNGQFYVENIEPGNYLLRISTGLFWYGTVEREVSVEAGKHTEVNIDLSIPGNWRFNTQEFSVDVGTMENRGKKEIGAEIGQTNEMMVITEWEGSTIGTQLITPDGVEIDPLETYYRDDLTFFDTLTSNIYVYNKPPEGKWKIKLTGIDVPQPEEYTVSVLGKLKDLSIGQYDINNNNQWEKSEGISAVNDYLFNSELDKVSAIGVLNGYLFGWSVEETIKWLEGGG